MTIEITGEQQQLVLLALAELSIERPGLDYALNEIAVLMDDIEEGRAALYDSFRKFFRR